MGLSEARYIIYRSLACFIKLFKAAMEQRTFKNVSNCLIINIYSYLETSGGQSSNLNLNVVHFFNTSIN